MLPEPEGPDVPTTPPPSCEAVRAHCSRGVTWCRLPEHMKPTLRLSSRVHCVHQELGTQE